MKFYLSAMLVLLATPAAWAVPTKDCPGKFTATVSGFTKTPKAELRNNQTNKEMAGQKVDWSEKDILTAFDLYAEISSINADFVLDSSQTQNARCMYATKDDIGRIYTDNGNVTLQLDLSRKLGDGREGMLIFYVTLSKLSDGKATVAATPASVYGAYNPLEQAPSLVKFGTAGKVSIK